MIFSLIGLFRNFQSLRLSSARSRQTRSVRRGVFRPNPLSPSENSEKTSADRDPSRRSSTAFARRRTAEKNFPRRFYSFSIFFRSSQARGTRKPALFRPKPQNFEKTFFRPFKIGNLRKIERRRSPSFGRRRARSTSVFVARRRRSSSFSLDSSTKNAASRRAKRGVQRNRRRLNRRAAV